MGSWVTGLMSTFGRKMTRHVTDDNDDAFQNLINDLNPKWPEEDTEDEE